MANWDQEPERSQAVRRAVWVSNVFWLMTGIVLGLGGFIAFALLIEPGR